MPRVQAGEVQLGWREWGAGDVTVVFIHGNLASKPADLLIIVGGDAGCPLVIVPLHRPFE